MEAAFDVEAELHPGRRRVAFAGFILVAGYFLWTEHRAHLVQYLPLALLALCPLLHVFMHRGHGGGES